MINEYTLASNMGQWIKLASTGLYNESVFVPADTTSGMSTCSLCHPAVDCITDSMCARMCVCGYFTFAAQVCVEGKCIVLNPPASFFLHGCCDS